MQHTEDAFNHWKTAKLMELIRGEMLDRKIDTIEEVRNIRTALLEAFRTGGIEGAEAKLKEIQSEQK